MPRNIGAVIGNNLSKGLITEATGMNFPENAVTDAENVVFNPSGSVERRKGFDVEGGAIAKSYQSSEGIIKEFLWRSVARTGGYSFLVVQMGDEIHFYEVTQHDSLSQQIRIEAILLQNYKAPGATDIHRDPVSLASGAGYLFIAHPKCDPIMVKYNSDTDIFEQARVEIMIRDFEGVQDGLGIVENPVNLSDTHHYNLMNQGWNKEVRVGTVSNEIGSGGPLYPDNSGSDPIWLPVI